jgi:hypothetical protein
MPMHDWTRVEAGVFHAFHHDWITELARALNRGLPPDICYALPELQAQFTVRHVSGDRIVAMLEIVSPGNKASRHAFRAFVVKACELLEHRVHLLIVDPFPPGPRDPNGIHAAIWEEVEDKPFILPKSKPLTLVAYECDLTTRAYIETLAVSDPLPDMPLFVEPTRHIAVPLETTYQTAFTAMPRRWRTVLEPPSAP